MILYEHLQQIQKSNSQDQTNQIALYFLEVLTLTKNNYQLQQKMGDEQSYEEFRPNDAFPSCARDYSKHIPILAIGSYQGIF